MPTLDGRKRLPVQSPSRLEGNAGGDDGGVIIGVEMGDRNLLTGSNGQPQPGRRVVATMTMIWSVAPGYNRI